MDAAQILLFTTVTILTALLVFLGVHVYFILRETKLALEKINKLLEDANLVSDSVARPIVGFANFLDGIKGLGSLLDMLTKKEAYHSGSKDDYEEGQETSLGHPHIRALQERGRRFFHREGKPLTS